MISYHFCGKQLYFVNPVKNVAILILTGLNTLSLIVEGKRKIASRFLTYPYRPHRRGIQANEKPQRANVQERNHDHPAVLPFWLIPQLQARLPLFHQGTSGKLLPQRRVLHAFRGTHAPRVLRPDGLHVHPRFWKVHGH